MLRTRVEVELESQNQDLLRNMNERVRMQLRLQQTVEGLSVAAITYYISSIAHLILEGVHQQEHALDPALATAIIVPFVAVLVWWNVRRLRGRHPVD
ncbi:Egg lysin (fragment) [Methylocella tundrae]